MSVSIFDSRTRSLVEVAQPPAVIGMYVCGPTVYQRAHIGNARPFIVFSWLRNWLQYRGHAVRFVHNITDVNDKIYDAAGAEASSSLASRAAGWYEDDIASLGLGLPDVMPRVTTSMSGIVVFIERLLDAGLAYVSAGGVYFRVGQMSDYGCLSGRVDQDSEFVADDQGIKESPRDFALWKRTKPGEDVSWSSPWGEGRPGWHIECSAMALEHLGPEFEIHGGGMDLLFPHHENERAQSAGLGFGFARIWMHNGMLEFAGEKMSKSLGNVWTLREVIDKWGAQTALMLLLSAHWRSPVRFSESDMDAAAARVAGVREALRGSSRVEAPPGEWERLGSLLDRNFNTPAALAVVHEWLNNGYLDLAERFFSLFGMGGLAERREAPQHVLNLAVERARARAEGRYGDADALRQSLDREGWVVRDSGDNGFDLVHK